MLKVIMLKDHRDYKQGDIIRMSCNEAHGLFEIGAAKKYDEAVLQKTELGKTKSFKKAPSRFKHK